METEIKVEDKDTTGAGVDRAPFRRGAMRGSAGAALDPTPAPKPWYRKWKYMVPLIAGGALVVGGGGYMLLRKR